jgi:hypothetical protein
VYVSLKMHISTLIGDNLLVTKDNDSEEATETVSTARMEISKNV